VRGRFQFIVDVNKYGRGCDQKSTANSHDGIWLGSTALVLPQYREGPQLLGVTHHDEWRPEKWMLEARWELFAGI
jgi:hypothetical protein